MAARIRSVAWIDCCLVARSYSLLAFKFVLLHSREFSYLVLNFLHKYTLSCYVDFNSICLIELLTFFHYIGKYTIMHLRMSNIFAGNIIARSHLLFHMFKFWYWFTSCIRRTFILLVSLNPPIYGLVQDCSNSNGLPMKLQQSRTKPSIYVSAIYTTIDSVIDLSPVRCQTIVRPNTPILPNCQLDT